MGYISKHQEQCFNFFVAIQRCSDLWLSEEAVWCYKEWNWFVTCPWKLLCVLLHLHSGAQATVSDLHFCLDNGMVSTRVWQGDGWSSEQPGLVEGVLWGSLSTQMLLWFHDSRPKQLLAWLLKRTCLCFVCVVFLGFFSPQWDSPVICASAASVVAAFWWELRKPDFEVLICQLICSIC